MIVAAICNCNVKDEHKIAYEMLSVLISTYLEKEANDVLKKADDKRPYLIIKDADVSVSHSHGVCAVVLSVRCPLIEKMPHFSFDAEVIKYDICAENVGIDVESVENINIESCQKTAERFFYAEEKELLVSAEEDSIKSEFARMWTEKESVFKTGDKKYKMLLDVNTEDLPENFCIYGNIFENESGEYKISICLKNPYFVE